MTQAASPPPAKVAAPVVPERVAVARPIRLGRPISRTRRTLGLIALLCLTLPYVVYAWFTREAYIRSEAQRVLSEATGGDVRIDGARFSLFEGIMLDYVLIQTPPEERFYGDGQPESRREIFSAATVTLRHDPWSLLIGRLRVREILATRPKLTVAYNADLDRYNWSLLARGAPGGKKAEPRERARIRLRAAEVSLARIEGNEMTPSEAAYTLDADAWPIAAHATAYEIDYRILGEAAHRIRGQFDPFSGDLQETPFVRYVQIRTIIPSDYRRFLDACALRGRFRLRRLAMGDDQEGPRRIQLEFEDASGALAMPFALAGTDQSSSIGMAPYRPLRLTHMSGSIAKIDKTIEIDINGRLNDATCRLDGRIDRIDLPVDQVGLCVNLSCEGFELPRDDIRAALLADKTVPDKLKAFLEDFDPRGQIDLNGQVARAPGVNQPVSYRGDLVAGGDLDLSYRVCPYRLTELSGVIRIGDDGIHVANLTGRHGDGRVTVNGSVDRPVWWSDFAVRIDAEAIQLDDALYAALNPTQQRVLDRIHATGRVDGAVDVSRSGGTLESGPGPWHTRLTVFPKQIAVKLDVFPYELTDLTGNVVVEHGAVTMEGIAARHGDGHLAFDGRATVYPDAGLDLELNVVARDLPLDDDLWRALPQRTREGVEAVSPTGYADVAGTIFASAKTPGYQYDLIAQLRDVAFRVRALPYPIRDARGEIHVTPDRLDIATLDGRHVDGPVSVQGDVVFDADGTDVRLAIDAADLPLDAMLHDALPTDVRATWERLAPAGRVDLTTVLRSWRDDGGWRTRHRTELAFSDARFTFDGLPIPIADATGRVIIRDDRIDIPALSGRPCLSNIDSADGESSDASVTLSGQVSLADPPRGELAIEARGLSLSNAVLRDSMPAALRDAMVRTQTQGSADLHLDRLSFGPHEPRTVVVDRVGATRNGPPEPISNRPPAASERQTEPTVRRPAAAAAEIAPVVDAATPTGDAIEWRACGRWIMRETRMNAGMAFTQTDGALSGEVVFVDGRLESINADAALDSTHADGWPLSNLTFNMRLDASELRLSDIRAEAMGGALTGFGVIEYRRGDPRYGLSISLADADLTEVGNILARPGDAPTVARGRVFASLSITGESGRDETREGRGDIALREAQVWKLPLGLAIFQALQLAPDDNAFDEADVKYFLSGRTMRLSRVDLRGHAISLLGAGTMDMQSRRLELTLAAATPAALRVPIVTQLLENAGRELVEVRVRGTPASPRITTQPLRSMRRILDQLFGPDSAP
jgi:hypothetical protein